MKLVRRDTLNVIEERVVYNAVVRWVKYDEERRQPTMKDVLHAVRCQHLPPSFLRDQVNNCDLVKKSPQCRKYLTDIFKVRLFGVYVSADTHVGNPNTHKYCLLPMLAFHKKSHEKLRMSASSP